jgi:hypothetical protein
VKVVLFPELDTKTDIASLQLIKGPPESKQGADQAMNHSKGMQSDEADQGDHNRPDPGMEIEYSLRYGSSCIKRNVFILNGEKIRKEEAESEKECDHEVVNSHQRQQLELAGFVYQWIGSSLFNAHPDSSEFSRFGLGVRVPGPLGAGKIRVNLVPVPASLSR